MDSISSWVVSMGHRSSIHWKCKKGHTRIIVSKSVYGWTSVKYAASPTPVCKPSPLFKNYKYYACLLMKFAALNFQNSKEEALRETWLNWPSIMWWRPSQKVWMNLAKDYEGTTWICISCQVRGLKIWTQKQNTKYPSHHQSTDTSSNYSPTHPVEKSFP